MTPNEGAAALRSLFPILTVPPAALHAATAAAGVTRSVCAEYVRVLCRTWLPKSKAELVGRGFDIGVASSPSLPLSTRSVGRGG